MYLILVVRKLRSHLNYMTTKGYYLQRLRSKKNMTMILLISSSNCKTFEKKNVYRVTIIRKSVYIGMCIQGGLNKFDKQTDKHKNFIINSTKSA